MADEEWGQEWKRGYGALILALLCIALAASTVLLMIARAERLDDGTVKMEQGGDADG